MNYLSVISKCNDKVGFNAEKACQNLRIMCILSKAAVDKEIKDLNEYEYIIEDEIADFIKQEESEQKELQKLSNRIEELQGKAYENELSESESEELTNLINKFNEKKTSFSDNDNKTKETIDSKAKEAAEINTNVFSQLKELCNVTKELATPLSKLKTSGSKWKKFWGTDNNSKHAVGKAALKSANDLEDSINKLYSNKKAVEQKDINGKGLVAKVIINQDLKTNVDENNKEEKAENEE